ncbi:regulatory protein viviparous-1-like [Phalaenopsis equestris]|uniref:regulatory protein viviparous-1-like n=1 Tax=Phalaenopsis equestris TaxID=78828 RepID=UPI0009E53950|nr:regulatory protein viviparous-1-like [Phalaenopsis equestris]
MSGSETVKMEFDTEASGFNYNKVVEFAGEEENPKPLSPFQDIFVDMEETAEKLFFSDEDDTFPSLSDFPCMSSPSASPSVSSATSTLPQPVPQLSTKSSSANSSETDAMHQPPPLIPAETEIEDRIVPIDAGFDIIGDEVDLWGACTEEPIESSSEPSSSFVSGETLTEEKIGFLCDGDDSSSEDLACVFLDWLKKNKDSIYSISPEDLRCIKLKRWTIECAARRLGGGKQGRIQLLKLILSWVQIHHLQNKRRRSRGAEATVKDREFRPPPPPINANIPFTHEATAYNPDIDSHYEVMPCSSWMPFTAESSFPAVMPAGYRGEGLPTYNFYQDQAFLSEPWQKGFSRPVGCCSFRPAPAAQYMPLYYPGMMATATKEARKRRMARQKRSFSLHHHRIQQQQNQQQQSFDAFAAVDEGSDSNNCSFFSSLPADIPSLSPAGEEAAVAAAAPLPEGQMEEENCLRRHASSSAGEIRRDDAQEGTKTEKNYRFLLQKVLKQSDVGSLGRIVLPKKEAELNLPELDARDGITIEMKDIGTSRVWIMRYRFWPNNKSRMYLLENTGDFVRSNGLREGDFIVIYSDIKSTKYMIRGVKVRQPVEAMKGGSNVNSGKAHQKKSSSSAMAASGSHLLENKGNSLCALGEY